LRLKLTEDNVAADERALHGPCLDIVWESSARFAPARTWFEHDPFRKPVSTPDQVRGRLFEIML
jgi:hypothetical protein